MIGKSLGETMVYDDLKPGEMIGILKSVYPESPAKGIGRTLCRASGSRL